MAAAFVIGGSVFLLLTVFDTLTNLNSVEMRDELTEVLRSPTGEGLGITMSQALTGMRVGLMVAGACAAATAVLGVYVLKPNRTARLALSILAVPILLTAPLTGGLTGALVVVAILMLWSGPARDWFAGRPVRELRAPGRPDRSPKQGPWETTMPRSSDRLHQPEDTPPPGRGTAPQSDQEAPEDRPVPPASELSTTGSSTEPGASTGFGTRPASVVDQRQEAWPQPGMTPPPGVAPGGAPSAVPASVKIACILTWVFSGVVALMYAGVLVALIVWQDQIVEYVVDSPEWQRSNLQEDILVPVLWLGCLMFLGWSLGACVLAWFTWRRHNWARWLLATSAAAAFIAGLIAFPVGILHQLAALLTIVGLFLSTSRTWFEQDTWSNTWQGPRSGPTTGPPQSPGSYPAGPPQDGPPQDGPPQDRPTQDGPPQDGPPQDGPPQDRPTQNGPPGGKPPVW